ncbi:hypothetical protein J1N35_024174 [Gossypium stocksii]|uniref:GIR1-like zinc ribbon domain-containing protein n=1 Tax=Gossypium stocksii TaxID=47602 RepID=A0A9D4A3V0_9ROSI|nr:hypothetical protein J1N35_024174 [Gossypium stocksii]
MSGGNGPKLELKLKLSPPRDNPTEESSTTAENSSPASSCVLSETNQMHEVDTSTDAAADGAAATPMMLVGCPRCLMYVMLSENDVPKCPKCKSTVLLDFLHAIKN